MSEHRGLHHISVIASDPQVNYDFYVKKLELTPWHESKREQIEAALPAIEI